MASATTFYGSDIYDITDLQLIDTLVINPEQLIGQRIARRLTTPRGALAILSDTADFGFDVRQFVNAKLSPGEIAAAQSSIQSEILKDEQVQTADVQMTLSGGSVSINITVTTSTGPFSLTLNVDQLTTALVFGNNT